MPHTTSPSGEITKKKLVPRSTNTRTRKYTNPLMKTPMQMILSIFIVLNIAQIVLGQTFDMVVAQDGSGGFTQISDAVAAAPINSLQKYFIKIKAGTYNERVQIGYDKKNLVLIGDGMDSTVITFDRSTQAGYSVTDTPTVDVLGDGFIAAGITFINSAGPSNDKAVALRSTSQYSAFYQCRFEGYEDTLFVGNGTQFYRNCEIYGSVDFIFGDAAVVFQNCGIYVRDPTAGKACYVTAQGRDSKKKNTGIVLHNCTITTDNNNKPHIGTKVYLGRPWRSLSTVVVMQSYLDDIIDLQGWRRWEESNDGLNTLYYGEYQNRGPSAVTNQRVTWKGFRVMPFSEAEKFTVRNFLQGEAWLPQLNIPFFPDLLPDVRTGKWPTQGTDQDTSLYYSSAGAQKQCMNFFLILFVILFNFFV
ncbi:pectinesterase-like isoform X2 [Apium graveolens]|uniref:pectinesterase-like isoform X2 n=1 Tax=Apium graveolens TaxID=4045 RepID=UPI003D79FE7B